MDNQKVLDMMANIEKFVSTQFEILKSMVEAPSVNVPVVTGFKPEDDMKATLFEAAEFGEELSEAELARQFNEQLQKPKPVKALSEMTLEDIKSMESAANNSTDIYKIKARVANLARESGGSLTPTGEILCNTYTHVLKSLYEFAEKIEDGDLRNRLTILIRNSEGIPGTVISAAGVGVKVAKPGPKRG
jgi:hypothetical protein